MNLNRWPSQGFSFTLILIPSVAVYFDLINKSTVEERQENRRRVGFDMCFWGFLLGRDLLFECGTEVFDTTARLQVFDIFQRVLQYFEMFARPKKKLQSPKSPAHWSIGGLNVFSFKQEGCGHVPSG